MLKRVSLREFTHNIKTYIKQLPLVLTQYNKDFLFISKYSSTYEQSTSKKKSPNMRLSQMRKKIAQAEHKSEIDKGYLVTTAKCQAKNALCMTYGQQYRITYFDSEGEHTEDRYLCIPHLRRAREMCEKIEEI